MPAMEPWRTRPLGGTSTPNDATRLSTWTLSTVGGSTTSRKSSRHPHRTSQRHVRCRLAESAGLGRSAVASHRRVSRRARIAESVRVVGRCEDHAQIRRLGARPRLAADAGALQDRRYGDAAGAEDHLQGGTRVDGLSVATPAHPDRPIGADHRRATPSTSRTRRDEASRWRTIRSARRSGRLRCGTTGRWGVRWYARPQGSWRHPRAGASRRVNPPRPPVVRRRSCPTARGWGP